MACMLVTGNCQTYGLAAALTALFPKDVVRSQHFPVTPEQVSDCDILVYDIFNGPVEHILAGRANPAADVKVVKFASIRFAGFHPDICYATERKTGQYTSYHYNSGLAVWAFNHGILPADAQALFCDDVFSALGYPNVFHSDLHAMRESFSNSDIDFSKFFRRIKRSGCFMHSCNHPSVGALVHLAKLIAERIDEEMTGVDNDLGIVDGLSAEIWPLYPQIAAQHALPGGTFDWKIGNVFIRGLRYYLDWIYDRYESSGYKPGDLKAVMVNGIDPAVYDRVLGAALKVDAT